jgi:hypothetical protein
MPSLRFTSSNYVVSLTRIERLFSQQLKILLARKGVRRTPWRSTSLTSPSHGKSGCQLSRGSTALPRFLEYYEDFSLPADDPRYAS